MNRLPEVVHAGAAFGAEEIHGGQRRDADLLKLHPREQAHPGLHQRRGAGRDAEGVGAGAGGAFQQRVDGDLAVVGARLHDPEGGEDGEFLAPRVGGADREPARGDAVAEAARDGAEVACALEDQELVQHVGAVDAVAQAEAGIAEVQIVPLRRLAFGEAEGLGVEVEVLAGEGEPFGRAGADHVDLQPVAVDMPRRQQVRLECGAGAGEEALLRGHADGAELIVAEIGVGRAQGHRAGAMLLLRPRAGEQGHVLEGADAAGRGLIGGRGRAQRPHGGGDGRGCEEGPAINHALAPVRACARRSCGPGTAGAQRIGACLKPRADKRLRRFRPEARMKMPRRGKAFRQPAALSAPPASCRSCEAEGSAALPRQNPSNSWNAAENRPSGGYPAAAASSATARSCASAYGLPITLTSGNNSASLAVSP